MSSIPSCDIRSCCSVIKGAVVVPNLTCPAGVQQAELRTPESKTAGMCSLKNPVREQGVREAGMERCWVCRERPRKEQLHI